MILHQHVFGGFIFSEPGVPRFEFVQIASDGFNISWGFPQESDKPVGYHHFVKYKKMGKENNGRKNRFCWGVVGCQS